MSPTILKYPNFEKQFTITVDASKKACGFILSQKHGDTDLPIYYGSRNFTKGEQNKSTIEQDLLAIYYAIKYFRPYVYGTSFIVKSDHKPLVYLFGLKDPSSKLTRIRLELEEYNFSVEHIKGTKNVTADALSRISIDELKNIHNESIFVTTRSMIQKENIDENENINETQQCIEKPKIIEHEMNKVDRNIPRIITKLQNEKDQPEKITISAYQKFKRLFEIDMSHTIINEKFFLEKTFSKLEKLANNLKITKLQWPINDAIFDYCTITHFKAAGKEFLNNLEIILIENPKLITNEEEKFNILNNFHNNPIFGGHTGQKKLFAKLRANYYWKNMSRDVAKFVRNCPKCTVNKVKSKTIEKMKITPTPQRAFDIVILDTIGPLPKSIHGNQYAVTLMCDLTKYLVTAPIQNKDSKTVAKAIFENFILNYGPMKNIRTDLGTEYKSQTIEELFKLLKINHTFSTAYHQTLGTIERNHRVLNEYLRAYLNEKHDDWDTYLKYFTFCYNINAQSSLGNMYTPFELVFAKKPNLTEILNGKVDPVYNIENYAKEMKYRIQTANETARKLIEKSKMKNKQNYDKKAKPINTNK